MNAAYWWTLQDPEDDVRAVAAESLVSVTDAISQTDHLTLTKLLTTLWNVLLSIEDLSLSTGVFIYARLDLHMVFFLSAYLT